MMYYSYNPEYLKEAYNKSRLHYVDLAEMIGINYKTLYGYISQRKTPQATMLGKLATCLNASPDYFYDMHSRKNNTVKIIPHCALFELPNDIEPITSMDNYYRYMHTNLSNARYAAKLTVYTLANITSDSGTKIHRHTISRWEDNVGEPDAKRLGILCGALRILPSQLYKYM